MSSQSSSLKFIKFKNNGCIWVTEPDKSIIEENINSEELYSAVILPHQDNSYCHLRFGDGSIARDVKREWFEVID